jgi:hypothetical protein
MFLFWADLAVIIQAVIAIGAVYGSYQWKTAHPTGTPGSEISALDVIKWIVFIHGSLCTCSMVPGLTAMFLFHMLLAAMDMTTLDWMIGSAATKKFEWTRMKALLCSASAIRECCLMGVSNFNKTCRKRSLIESCNPFYV